MITEETRQQLRAAGWSDDKINQSEKRMSEVRINENLIALRAKAAAWDAISEIADDEHSNGNDVAAEVYVRQDMLRQPNHRTP